MNKLLEKFFAKPKQKSSPIQEFLSPKNRKRSDEIYKEVMKEVDRDQERIIELAKKI